MNASLTGFYDYRLVGLSVLISIFAACAALDLAGRVTVTRGRARLLWLCCGAIAMGTGIWSMHYIGMAAFQLSIPVEYDWPTVLLSLCAAIVASRVALSIASRSTMGFVRTAAGSIFMGCGIAAMHYIGMEAMRLQAMCVYSPALVTLSVALAIAISYVALRLTFASRDDLTFWSWRKTISSLVLGLAIPVMHYVGMAAVRFMPTDVVSGSLRHALGVSTLGVAQITVGTLLIQILVFVSSSVDRRMSAQMQGLRENRMQLQAIFDTMTEAIIVVDHDRGTVEHNRAAADLLALGSQAISVREMADMFEVLSATGEVLDREQWPLMRATQGNFCKDTEVTIRRTDTGAVVTAEVTTVPVATQGNDSHKIVISLRDVRERKRMDEARTRLVAIVESSEDAIIGKDAEGVVTSWNAGAQKIFGYAAAEMIGCHIKRLLPPDREQEEDDILNRIRQGHTVEHLETVRRRKDGEFIQVSLTISPIKDASGNVVGASKIARDITETRKLEGQLHQSRKMDAIGQLTGGIAHDFNNLLGIILGNLDLLAHFASSNETALEQVQTSQRAATRGADLIRRLLAFARMEGLKPASTLLNSSIQSTIAMAKRALGPEITITTQFDESLPRVFVDGIGLESALLNLVVNARDAMPGGGSIAISTRLINIEESHDRMQMAELKAGWYACASISDTGHGMSRETLERVFEPFFTTKQRDKGTGLGLAMVYGFVSQSGGAVRIYSEPGRGTTVSMYLPLDEHSSELNIAAPEEYSLLKLNANVLVVDDETELLKIAHAYLLEMGCTALQATDGATALEVVQREKGIDLMVTDIIMPGGMNGVELARRAHQLNPNIKIIYSSGFPADALEERKMSLVDGPLLHKPYQRSEFRTIVRTVLEGVGAARE